MVCKTPLPRRLGFSVKTSRFPAQPPPVPYQPFRQVVAGNPRALRSLLPSMPTPSVSTMPFAMTAMVPKAARSSGEPACNFSGTSENFSRSAVSILRSPIGASFCRRGSTGSRGSSVRPPPSFASYASPLQSTAQTYFGRSPDIRVLTMPRSNPELNNCLASDRSITRMSSQRDFEALGLVCGWKP